jgi:hypothetical protein
MMHLREGNLDFLGTSGRSRINCRDHFRRVVAQNRPLGISQNHKSDCAARQLLLILDVLVICEKNIEARALGSFQQFTVCQPFPATVGCLDNSVSHQSVL